MIALSRMLQLGLEDLLGDLRHARRQGDLGRLALLAYCEVRRWARAAHQPEVAEHSARLVTHSPHASREEFLAGVDALLAELEQVHASFGEELPRDPSGTQDGGHGMPGATPAPGRATASGGSASGPATR